MIVVVSTATRESGDESHNVNGAIACVLRDRTVYRGGETGNVHHEIGLSDVSDLLRGEFEIVCIHACGGQRNGVNLIATDTFGDVLHRIHRGDDGGSAIRCRLAGGFFVAATSECQAQRRASRCKSGV